MKAWILCLLFLPVVSFAQGGSPPGAYGPSSSSGSAIINGAGSNPLGASLNVKAFPYSAGGAGKFFVDGVTNAGNNQLTSATATFTSADVGLSVWCTRNPLSSSAALWPASLATVTGLVNASTITYSGANGAVQSGQFCGLVNPQDAAAVLAAFNACKSATPNGPQQGTSFQNLSCNIYLPGPGVFGIANTLNNLITTGNEPCVGIVGDGQYRSVLLLEPTYSNAGGNGALINDRCGGAFLKDFTIELASVPIAFGLTSTSIVNFSSSQSFLENVAVVDQCNTNGAVVWGMQVTAGSNIAMMHPTVINTSTCAGGASNGGLQLINASQMVIYSPFLSNSTAGNLDIENAPSGANGAGTVIVGGVVDEGAVSTIKASQDVWLTGLTLTGGANSLSVDGTSTAWIFGGYEGTFGGNTGGGPTVAAGGKLYITGAHVNAVNAGSACWNGLGTIFDEGGNSCTTSGGGTIYGAGASPVIFPLQTNATTQLGGRQVVSGTAPSGCTVTGNGTSTCALDTGSTDASGTITISASGTTTAVGLVSITYNSTTGTNSTVCNANYLNGTGTWAIGAIPPIFVTDTTTAMSFNINNAGTNLTAASTYKVNYECYGK